MKWINLISEFSLSFRLLFQVFGGCVYLSSDNLPFLYLPKCTQALYRFITSVSHYDNRINNKIFPFLPYRYWQSVTVCSVIRLTHRKSTGAKKCKITGIKRKARLARIFLEKFHLLFICNQKYNWLWRIILQILPNGKLKQ